MATKTQIVRRLKREGQRHARFYALYKNAVFVNYALRDGLWKRLFQILGRANANKRQTPLVWKINLPVFAETSEFVSWLEAQGVKVIAPGHTIYLSPQNALGQVFPEPARLYPPNSGFKILKTPGTPEDAIYLTNASKTLARQRMVGNPREQVVPANYLHVLGLGPRIWDVCQFKSDTASYTAFVVEHLDGGTPSEQECEAFLERLENILKESCLRIGKPNWREHRDFACPSCNGNLIKPNKSEQALYVDFQNFVTTGPDDWTKDTIKRSGEALHFGRKRQQRGGNYLYQSVPAIRAVGKRNTEKRWQLISGELKYAGLSLKDRIVLDVGCSAGMMIHNSLSEGAAWGIGWDHQTVVERSQELLLSLGTTRFSLIGTELELSYPLEKDIPEQLRDRVEESVLYYLSVHQQIGVLGSLKRIPWRLLVFEGHQREKATDIPNILGDVLTGNIRCLYMSQHTDGDSSARPIAIYLRE